MFTRDPTGSALATEALNSPETLDSIPTVATPSSLDVLLAPLDAIVRPAAAARTLAAAPAGAFCIVFFLLSIAFAVALACVPILLEMFEFPADVSFREAWWTVNRGQRVGPVEALFAVGLLMPCALSLAATWLTLTRTLRSERVFPAAWRMFRAQASIIPFVLALGVAYFTLLLFTGSLRDNPIYHFIARFVPPEPFTAVIGALLCRSLAWRVEVAATAVENDGIAPSLGPTCEGCGYDLTHTATDGLCTECGRPVVDSLTPGRVRRGAAWENNADRSASAWVATTFEVLVNPRRFYETLAMHTDLSAARRFAVMHLRWIGLIGAVWVVLVTFAERVWNRRWWNAPDYELAMNVLLAVAFLIALALGTPLGRFASWRLRSLIWLAPVVLLGVLVRPELGRANFRTTELFWLCLLVLCVAPLACWIGQRLGGAIISTIAIYFRFLPDFRRAEKVILYESVVLWLYCTAWGLLVSSYILFADWMSRSPLFKWIWNAFGILPEFSAVLGVTIAISVLWARRYLTAFRAVRWANF